MDRPDTPISLAHDGITVAFFYVPGGRTQVEAECRTALFFPTSTTGEELEGQIDYLRHLIERAFRWGVKQEEAGHMHPYDLTQPQVMASMIQTALVVDVIERDLDTFTKVCVCTPQEAAAHGWMAGRVLRVYATEGDTPALWRVYRLMADQDHQTYLELLDRHVQTPRKVVKPVAKPARRKPRTAVAPLFDAAEQAALLGLRERLGRYNAEKMATDGAPCEDETTRE